jgi:hypothetical protein
MFKIMKLLLFWWFLLMFTPIFGYESGSGKSYGSLRIRIHNTDFSAYFRPNFIGFSLLKHATV